MRACVQWSQMFLQQQQHLQRQAEGARLQLFELILGSEAGPITFGCHSSASCSLVL